MSFEDMEYILVVHQGDSVVTIFFEDLLTDVHLYNYGEIGHFWMKDYEYLRQLEYRLAIMNESLRCWWIFSRLITAVILQCRNNTAIAKGRKRFCYFKRRTIRDCKRQYRLSDSSDDLGEGNLKQESENRELFAGKG